MALALVLLLVNSALQIANPALTRFAIDRYLVPVEGQTSWFDAFFPADRIQGLTWVSVAFLLSLLFTTLSALAQSYIIQRAGQLVMFDIRRELHGHLQKLDISYFDRNPLGNIMTRLTADVEAVNEMLSSGIVSILGDLLVVVFLLGAMIQLSPELTGLMLAVAPLIGVVLWRFRIASKEGNTRVRAAVARINTILQEHITGMSVLQLFNRERHSARELDEANRESQAAYQVLIQAHGWFYPFVEFFGMLSVAGILSYGGYQIRMGELTAGALIAFFQYAMRFFRPLQSLSDKFGLLQQAAAGGSRIFQLLDEKPSVEAPASPRVLPASTEIEFDHVWFAYSGEDWVVRDLSFRVRPGEMIAVVGHTGAGKTTLTSLLLRFYDVRKGTIRVGGTDIRELDPRDLRRMFGVVLQDSFLFTGDIESNIRLATPGITREQVAGAAARVNLEDFVGSLEKGYAHPVKERGAGLSTGQKQLISFARALAHDPRILILDEATSSVDTDTEHRIRGALEELLTGRTSIVVAHRLSTIQRADRIFVMHRGELVESGPHQELLARRGLYWKLYQLQYKDQESGSGV